MSGTTSQSVYSSTNLTGNIGVNIDPTVNAATTLAELAQLGIKSVRVTDNAANLATLQTLAAGGIAIDLVLGQTETADQLISDAKALDSSTPNSVRALEGPNVADNPNYAYTAPADAFSGGGQSFTGVAAGDQATYDVFNAAHLVSTNSVLANTPIISYSLTSSAGAPVGTPATLGNISLHNTGIAEFDEAAFNSAASAAAGTSVSGEVPPPASTYISTSAGGATGVANYAVTELGASTGAQLGDIVLDSLYLYTGNGRTPVAGGVTFIESLTPDTSATGSTPVSLFDGGGSLTVAGSEIANLEAIIGAGTNAAAGATLALNVPDYVAGTQAADNTVVFAGPGGSDNVVWLGDDESPSAVGHGPASIGFSSVEGKVSVFDPTKGAAAVATFTNISSLSVSNFGDGPLVVQVSNTAGAVPAGASTVGTYAGGASGTVAGGSGTVTGGTGGGGAGTVVGGSGTSTATGVATMAGASGGTIFTSPVSGQSTITASAAGDDIINSRGSDTINAGGGNDLVFASGVAATVNGGSGNLTFVAGSGSYTAGGGSATDILYGGSGSDVLTGGSGANSIIVAGSGNTSLVGGAGHSVLMFGGPATNTFSGSGGGGDTMVGGAGGNSFAMTNNDVAFGGPNGSDSYNAGAGGALIVEGPGNSQIHLGGGNLTAFEGAGVDTYSITKGTGGGADIIGFKAGDQIVLTGGFTAADASNAASTATKGSFGTTLNLSDGTKINLFGINLDASQVSAG